MKALFLSVSVTIKSDGAVKNFYIGHLIGHIHCTRLSRSKTYFIIYKISQRQILSAYFIQWLWHEKRARTKGHTIFLKFGLDCVSNSEIQERLELKLGVFTLPEPKSSPTVTYWHTHFVRKINYSLLGFSSCARRLPRIISDAFL